MAPRNRIREIRKAKGLTIVQLSEKAGISHPYLVRIEGGQRRLSLALAERLAAVLEVTVGELVGFAPGEAWATPLCQDAEHDEGASARDVEMRPRRNSNSVERWRVLSPALDRVGIAKGSFVFVDRSPEAIEKLQIGDRVLAVVDPDGKSPIYILRQFLPPSMLVSNSSQANDVGRDIEKGDATIVGAVRGNYVSF